MAGESDRAPLHGEELRRFVPVFALAIAIFATVADRSSSATDLVLAAVPVVALGLWAYVPNVRLSVISVAVIAPVVVAQRSGELEPLFFEVCLLAFVVGRWSPSLTRAAGLGVPAAASPVAVSLIQDPSEIAVGIWILGIAFPWAIGYAVGRRGNWQPSSMPLGASSPSRRCSRSGVGSPATSTTSSDTGLLP